MNIEFIEEKIADIVKELEREVMEVLMDESLGKGETNLRVKPLSSTKQILENALDSIRMVDKLNKEDLKK
jgi:aryl carrier-like protein